MRFNFTVTKCKDLAEWHKWFAWHPVKISDRQYAWLENVERRCNYTSGSGYDFEHIGFSKAWSQCLSLEM